MQWTGTWDTRTWLRRSFTTLRSTNAACICVNPVLALQLWENFLIRKSTNMKIIRNLITVSGTLRIEQYWQPLQPLTKNTKRLIDVIDDLTRHSYIAKLKITSSWYRTKSKATTGVKNTASYIPWLYTTWDQMVASNMIHCVLVLMTTTITQAFCIKFKQCLFIILKIITHIWEKTNLLLWQLWRTAQNYKNFMEERLCSHKHDFGIGAEWISVPCDDIAGAVKTTCSQEKPPKVFE